MVLCKFYAQGKCKYGDRCRFEHVRDQGGRNYSYQNNRNNYSENNYRNNYRENNYRNNYSEKENVFARNSTGKSRQNNQSQSRRNNRKILDIDGVTAMIKKDVDEWRQSKCWPFSVYSPKLSGEIPDNYMDEGLPDISPEEMRLIYLIHGKNDYQSYDTRLKESYNQRKQQLSDIMIDTSLKNSIFTQIENNQQNEPSKNLQIPKLYLNSTVPQKLNKNGNEAVVEDQDMQTDKRTFSSNQSSGLQQASNNTSASLSTSSNFPSQTPPVPSSAPTLQGNLFGSSSQQKETVTSVDPNAYTDIDKIPELELSLFKADSFTMYCIPMIPPPLELC